MQTIEQLQAKQAATMARLEKELAVAKLLPAVPHYVDASANMGWPLASYKVKGIRGAIAMLKAFTVVPFTEYRDGCTRLQPVQFVPESKRDTHAGQWALAIGVNTDFVSTCNAGTDVRIRFFARVEGLDVVNIWLDVEGPNYIGSFQALAADCQMRNTGRFGHGRTVVAGSVRPNAAMNRATDKFIQWSTGTPERANIDYLVRADLANVDTPAAELTHALAVLTGLSAEFDAKETI